MVYKSGVSVGESRQLKYLCDFDFIVTFRFDFRNVMQLERTRIE